MSPPARTFRPVAVAERREAGRRRRPARAGRRRPTARPARLRMLMSMNRGQAVVGRVFLEVDRGQDARSGRRSARRSPPAAPSRSGPGRRRPWPGCSTGRTSGSRCRARRRRAAPRTSWSPTRTARTRQREEQAEQQDAPRRRARRRPTPLAPDGAVAVPVGDRWSRHRRLLVASAACGARRRRRSTLRPSVIRNSRRPRKKRLWNAERVAGDLVAAGRERGHRRRSASGPDRAG